MPLPPRVPLTQQQPQHLMLASHLRILREHNTTLLLQHSLQEKHPARMRLHGTRIVHRASR